MPGLHGNCKFWWENQEKPPMEDKSFVRKKKSSKSHAQFKTYKKFYISLNIFKTANAT